MKDVSQKVKQQLMEILAGCFDEDPTIQGKQKSGKNTCMSGQNWRVWTLWDKAEPCVCFC